MSAEASGLVSIVRAELDALKVELKRLRCEVGRGVAMARIQAGPGQGMTRPRLPARNSPKRGEYVSDRLVRFPASSWQEIEALPQPLRSGCHQTWPFIRRRAALGQSVLRCFSPGSYR